MNVINPTETNFMKEVKLRKQEIDEKLQEDMRKRDLIKKNLERANQLTEQMVSTLDHFDERLKKLEDTILPVHRQTKDLQRLQDNVERTMNSLEHVISYHRVAHSVTPVIQKPVGSNVDSYIACMKKLQGAINFFSEISPGSPELNTVTTLFNKGNETLEKEFQSCLTRHMRAWNPQVLSDLISKENTEMPEFLSENVIESLSEIARWLTSVDKNTAFVNSYTALRRKHLIDSLEIVRDHVKSQLSGNTRKMTGSSATPKRSMSKVATLRKMSGMLKKDTLPSSTVTMGHGKGLTTTTEELDDLDIQPFISMSSLMLKLLNSEHKLMQLIIPANFHQQVFIDTINGPLNVIETAFNKFLHYSKQCMETRDHSSIVSIFPIAHYLRQDQRGYQDILKEADEHNRKRIPRLLAQLQDIGRSVMEEFIDTVKSDPEKESNMPKDGTVHELTSNTMMFVQQLAATADVAGRMLLTPHSPDQNHRLVLAKYLSNILAALKLNLDKKSRTYDDTSLRSIFLINNYYFIIMALVRENQLDLVRLATPNIDTIYYSQIKEAKLSYMQSWQRLGDLLKSSKGIEVQPGGKLREKDRQAVKEIFKTFNNEFEELVKVQQKWAVPNVEIKNQIRQEINGSIFEQFSEMSKRFRIVQFTKNIEKFIKYTPENVSAEVNRIFSQTSS